MELPPFESLRSRGRTSLAVRVRRWQSKRWHIGQCAVAAALAWFVAADLLGHPSPFFAPIAAVACLGTSYGQRLRRVGEVGVGVAIGVAIGDLLVLAIGNGPLQLGLVVALAMSAAILLDASALMVIQAAVQAIIVTALVPQPAEAWTRCIDAAIGAGFALLAATLVPAAPLRRPREQAAVVVRKVAKLLRASAEVMDDGELDHALEVLADARSSDALIRELQAAADEGMSVVRSSPFKRRHRDGVRRMADLVEPLDKALRGTRVLARRTTLAVYHGRQVPEGYAEICRDLAGVCDEIAAELREDNTAEVLRPALLELAERTGTLERTHALSLEVVVATLRSIIADLLELTGLSPMAATAAIPHPGPGFD